MPARIANAATHSLAITGSASGNLTNSGSRTVGGLENLPGQSGNTFTMTETGSFGTTAGGFMFIAFKM